MVSFCWLLFETTPRGYPNKDAHLLVFVQDSFGSVSSLAEIVLMQELCSGSVGVTLGTLAQGPCILDEQNAQTSLMEPMFCWSSHQHAVDHVRFWPSRHLGVGQNETTRGPQVLVLGSTYQGFILDTCFLTASFLENVQAAI